VAEGWTITLDMRHDHSAVWTDLHKSDVLVMTHVMEIRRSDGAAFTAQETEPVLAAMHVGISFALGRWVAPLLPVGLDSSGTAVWEQWKPTFCDPGSALGVGWWYERDHAALSDFLELLITAFSDPDRKERLWMQMVLAISAISAPGFIEHPIMVGFSGIEHVMWQNLVLAGLRTENDYRRADAGNKLRDVLTAASIPAGIDSSLQPVISNLSAAKRADGVEPRRSRGGRLDTEPVGPSQGGETGGIPIPRIAARDMAAPQALFGTADPALPRLPAALSRSSELAGGDEHHRAGTLDNRHHHDSVVASAPGWRRRVTGARAAHHAALPKSGVFVAT
jgi:hypothetical protein